MPLHKLREKNGRWTRERVSRWYAIVGVVIVGVLFFSFSPSSKHSSVSNVQAQEVVEHFQNGDCMREAGQLACSFTDKDTLRKWNETYPKKLEQELEGWKLKAGAPSAILKRVCRDEGFYDADCPRILYGMAKRESQFGTLMVGDGGRSIGWFHILDIHKNVTKACKMDLECSARFSLGRMIEYGFEQDRDRGIMAHNGTPGIPATVTYLNWVKTYMQDFDSLQ